MSDNVTSATCTTDNCPHCQPLRDRLADLLAYMANAKNVLTLAER